MEGLLLAAVLMQGRAAAERDLDLDDAQRAAGRCSIDQDPDAVAADIEEVGPVDRAATGRTGPASTAPGARLRAARNSACISGVSASTSSRSSTQTSITGQARPSA
jgi:hypothetical protein